MEKPPDYYLKVVCKKLFSFEQTILALLAQWLVQPGWSVSLPRHGAIYQHNIMYIYTYITV